MKKILSVLGFLSCLFIFGCTNNKVNIQFESNGGSPVSAITSIDDIEGGMPTPTKEGNIFIGWFEDEALTDPFEVEEERDVWEITLYAKWQPLTLTLILEHYQEAVDGTFVFQERETNPQNLNLSSINFDISDAAKVYPGFTVAGNLTTVDSKTTPGTIVIKLYYTRNLYTITIDEAGGEEVQDITVKYGHTITAVTVTKAGFTFNGFTPSLPSTMPIDGLTVVANWTPLPEVIVSFEENGGVSTTDITTYQGAKITAPVITKVGYEFAGWYTNSSLTTSFDALQAINTSLTLYAKWTPASVNYTVEYYYESLTGTYEYNSSVTLQALTESTVSASTIPSSQFTLNTAHVSTISSGTVLPDGSLVLKLYADRNDYTISFETNASLSISSIVAPYNQSISAPTNPIRTNYIFNGWFSDSQLTQAYTFNNMPGNNITLYASWIGVDMHLYFNSMGGSVIPEIIAPYNSAITAPATPVYNGYAFDGWYTDPVAGTLFNEWIMPSGNIMLFARWSPKQYSIIYESNGGTTIPSSIHLYKTPVIKPENPTKTDYIFKGWYTDEDLTIPFDFSAMPANNLTLYAKWMSELESKYLENIITYDEGTFVETTGIVYAIQSNGYTGFYILDDTSQLFVLANPGTLAIGDLIKISGIIHFWNDTPTLMHTSELSVTSSGNPLPNLIETALSDAITTKPALDIYSSRILVKGLVVKENDSFYLLNPLNGDLLYLTERFYLSAQMELLINQYITAELLFLRDANTWQFGLIDYQVETLSSHEKATFSFEWIARQIDDFYFSFDKINFQTADPYGFGQAEFLVDFRNDDYIDGVNLVFLSVAETVSVLLPFRINIDDLNFNFEKVITLEPITYTTIADLFTSPPETNYLIHGYVAAVIMDGYRYVLIDNTGHIYFDYHGEVLHVGDEVVIYTEKDNYFDYFGIESSNVITLEIISSENDINYPAIPMTILEFNQLNFNDPTVYGRYVELQGFLHSNTDLYHEFWLLTDELESVQIMVYDYNAYESLFTWFEQEVIMRGFIDLDSEGNPILSFIGIRRDIQLPTYTDQELIDAIMTSFRYFYGEKTFLPYEEFILYPYHPLLGGEITWTFLNGSEQYYDAINRCFIFVDEAVQIDIEMNISKNEVSQTYVYHTILNPFNYTSAADLKQVDNYETVYIKGLVIYRTTDEVYLLDNTGIIRTSAYELDVFAGDLVVLKGIKYSEYDNNSPYVYISYENNNPMVVEILSRYNDVVIPQSLLTLDQIAETDLETAQIHNQYVEVSGLLYGDTTGYDYFYLTNGSNEISIWPVDEYTYYKLADFVLKNGNHVFATIKGFILGYDEDELSWTILYTGQDADVTVATLTDEQKAIIIENHLRSSYEVDYVGGNETVSLPDVDPFFNALVTYETKGANAAVVNLTTHVIENVTVETKVTVEATITINAVTRVFTFIMTVIPDDVVVIPRDTADIVSLMTTSPFDIIKIRGTIIAFSAVNDGYVFLVQDSTGMVFVRTDYSNYYYDTQPIGKFLNATGSVEYENGRLQFRSLQYTIETPKNSVVIAFTPTSSKDIETFDLYHQMNYGKPIEVTGKLINAGGDLGYQLVNGDQVITLSSSYPSSYDLERYLGLIIKVKGFFFGQFPSNDQDTYSMLYVSYNYGSGDIISLHETTDQGKAEIALQMLLKQLPNYPLTPYNSYYIITYVGAIPNAIVNYEITEGFGYAQVSSFYLNTYLPPTATSFTLRVTVTVNTGVATADVVMNLNTFIIGTIDELLTAETGTLEFTVEGVVIHGGWGFIYVLVNGKVYYLEQFLDYYPEVGDFIIISGYKTVIDGYSDFTYEIEAYRNDNYISDFIMPVDVAVYELYEYIDLIYSSGLSQHLLTVTATLKYDTYLDMFYLEEIYENIPYKIYLREDMVEESEEFGYVEDGMISRNDFFTFIGEEITLNLLFNFHTILDTYFVLDFRGLEDDFYYVPASPSHALDNAAYRLQLITDNLHLKTGDYLMEYLPYYDQVYNNIELVYTLKNSADGDIIHMDNYGIISPMNESKLITLVATLSFYEKDNSEIITKTVEFTLEIKPLELSSVKEVIFSNLGQVYYFKGIVEYAYSDYDGWIILNDGLNRIYVDCYGCLSYEGYVYQTGDEIEIVGERSTYERNGYVPLVDSIRWIKVLSSGHTVTKTPIVMTVDDMLALDYTNPLVYGYYVQISGTLVFSGNVDYPSFDIYEPGRATDDYNIQLWDDDYESYDERFYPLLNNTVTLTGYLIGFEYIYDYFDWIVYVDQVVSSVPIE